MPDIMIQADGLVKIYKSKQTEVLALQGLDLTVEAGEFRICPYEQTQKVFWAKCYFRW